MGILLFLLVFSIFESMSSTRYYPNDPLIKYRGRFKTTDTERYIFDISESRIYAKFNGDEITVHLELNTLWYNIYIDGVRVRETTAEDITISTSDGEHVIEVSKRVEGLSGTGAFTGFTADELVSFDFEEKEKVIIYGDSNTCAYGVLSNDKDDPYLISEVDSSQSYAVLFSKSVDLDYRLFCMSGFGMVRNVDEEAHTSTDPLPTYADEICISSWAECGIYDYEDFVPDYVIIFLGNNDFSWGQDDYWPDETTFKNGYRDFMDVILGRYPLLKKFYLIAKSTTSDFSTYVEELSEEYDAEFLHMPTLNELTELGSAWHPNVAGQEKYAEALELAFLGLNPPEEESAEQYCDNDDVEISICETAQALQDFGYEGRIETMTRIAYYESRYHPQACNLDLNENGSHDYGLFQINNYYFCTEPNATEWNQCDVGCAKLLLNLDEQVKCVEYIRQLQGLEAWAAYNSNKEDCDNYVLPEECEFSEDDDDDDEDDDIIVDVGSEGYNNFHTVCGLFLFFNFFV